jgi:putative heme-binding domain-containing protein
LTTGRLIFLILLAANAFAQPSPEALAQGESLYAARCAACHGKDLRGGEGPSLFRSRIVTGSPDERFFEVIRKGIPGTEMVAMPLTDQEIRRIVSFVHSLTKPGQGPPVRGDAAEGRKIFETAGCPRCHIVDGKGGVLGPDLSSVALRLSSGQIREAVRHARMTEGFRRVIVNTRTGRSIEGMLKNEDNFSIQVMTLQGELVSVQLSDTVSLKLEAVPLLESETVRTLAGDELQNLLAYLDRQRAPFLHHEIGFQTY